MNVGPPHWESPAPQFTVVSWNCRRATAGSPLWDYLLELDPDVALLLTYCSVGSRERVFGASLSDHLPIVARFRRDPSLENAS